VNLVRAGIVLVMALTIAVTGLAYPALPAAVPSHWNAAGEVDGYLPTLWGVLVVPAVMVALVALLILLPGIDPLRENYPAFRRQYDGFVLVFVAFLFAIQLQILLWGLGYPISPNLLYPLLLGALFIAIGVLLRHARPNWFVGIRTPWTLSSERVWTKTHARGGVLFVIAGLVAMAGALFGPYALWFVLVPALAVSVYLVAYSYFEYRREGAGAG
jgi:uncharacterized membrane protein